MANESETTEHTYDGILLSHIKECNSAIFNNMSGPRKYNGSDLSHRYHLYVESKKIKKTDINSKIETDSLI